MAWDIGISEHGDIVMTGHRDIGGKSGIDLIEQRMLLRLRITRGSWVFDDNDTLGSNLSHLSGLAPEKAAAIAPAYVQEALRTMDEIIVEDIHITTTPQSIGLMISYHISEVDVDAGTAEQTRQLEISLPLSGGGG